MASKHYYLLQNSIPEKLNITVKENITSLTGQVIKDKYYFSIEDYQKLNITINGIIEVLNYIYPKNLIGLNLSSVTDLKDDIITILTSNFSYIYSVNGNLISSNQDLRKINVLTNFNINNIYYNYNDYNGGRIKVEGYFLPGSEEDYVQNFNGKTGDVTGISAVVINGELKQPVDGLLDLSFLVPKNNYIISINDDFNSSFTDKSNILSTVYLKAKNNTLTYTPSSNNGKIYINEIDHFFIPVTLHLVYDNQFLTLHEDNSDEKGVDKNNNKTAINGAFLKEYNQDIILKKTVNIENKTTPITFTLPLDYYPLHFYDINVSNNVETYNWLSNITWTIRPEDKNNEVKDIICTIPNGTVLKAITAIKVEKKK